MKLRGTTSLPTASPGFASGDSQSSPARVDDVDGPVESRRHEAAKGRAEVAPTGSTPWPAGVTVLRINPRYGKSERAAWPLDVWQAWRTLDFSAVWTDPEAAYGDLHAVPDFERIGARRDRSGAAWNAVHWPDSS